MKRTETQEQALVWATSIVATNGPDALGPVERARLTRDLDGPWGPEGISHAESLACVVEYWWDELTIRIVAAIDRQELGLAAAFERMIDIAWDQPGLCGASALLEQETGRGGPPLTGPVEPVLAATYPGLDTSLVHTLVSLVVDQAARRYPVESHVEIQAVLQRLEQSVDRTLSPSRTAGLRAG